jgi:hypothetical protein
LPRAILLLGGGACCDESGVDIVVGVFIGAIAVAVGALMTFRIAVAGVWVMSLALADHNMTTNIAKTPTAKIIPPRITLKLNQFLTFFNMASLYRH